MRGYYQVSAMRRSRQRNEVTNMTNTQSEGPDADDGECVDPCLAPTVQERV